LLFVFSALFYCFKKFLFFIFTFPPKLDIVSGPEFWLGMTLNLEGVGAQFERDLFMRFGGRVILPLNLWSTVGERQSDLWHWAASHWVFSCFFST